MKIQFPICHIGFTDGLARKDPDSFLKNDSFYMQGWNAGIQSNIDMDKHWYMPVFKRGDRVVIPRGTLVSTTAPEQERLYKKSTTVKLHDIIKGVPAYISYDEFFPPAPSKLLWVGSGGYWCYANAEVLLQ